MNAECIISSFIEDVFPNRQAELDLQAFPNRVWEREKPAPAKSRVTQDLQGF
jgi:hypothetical protein